MRKQNPNSPQKNNLFDAAQKLILAQGYAGTSVDDICRCAKVTKGSFFHYFKSKEELGVELLKRYCCSTKDAFLSCSCGVEKDPLKRIYKFLDFMTQMTQKNNGRGCLLGSMAQELAETNAGIRLICENAFFEMSQILKKDLKEAKAKYAPKADFDPASLAEHFVVVLQGTQLVSKVQGSKKSKANGMVHFKKYLEQLFKK